MQQQQTKAIQLSLFGEPCPVKPKIVRAAKFADYDGFVEKFKPKKTTDDCYTPQPVYETLRIWVNDNIRPLDNVEIVRPFYPGGDYENYDYPEGCVVLDNPPFSILAKIRRFYTSRGIPYFLFAPALTLFASAASEEDCFIVAGASIVYANGAVVSTSFVTNMIRGVRIWVAGDLTKALETANEKGPKDRVPVYDYPECIVTSARLQKIAIRGVSLKIAADDCVRINSLDSQRGTGKTLFGNGYLISEKAAAEKAAAEKAAAEKAAAEKAAAEKAAARARIIWPLSEREKAMQAKLGERR